MPKSAPIIAQLLKDVEAWASTYASLLSDERDMQVQLAMYLANCGWVVHTEYRVPLRELTGRLGLPFKPEEKDPRFPWPNDISVDIVAERDGEFAAVELKYATRPIEQTEKIFDENLRDPKSQILKDQGAADLVMYNYWKDVRRIEALTSAFPALKGGVALIISNNRAFRTKPEGTPSYLGYSTFEGNTIGSGMLRWGDKAESISQSHPDFELTGQYLCHWLPTAMPFKSKTRPAETFHYLISIV